MNDETARRDRILIVDDSPETLGFLTDALERSSLTALVATDGASALALVDQITPDLILLDAVMPGMDGFETCRQLKQHKRAGHVPVIFMTALSETEHVVEGLRAGGVDYVTKPIVVDELLARIRVHLANARIAYGARSALDVIGRCLLATDETGALLWSTPQAEALLGQIASTPGANARLPEALADGLGRLRQGPIRTPNTFTTGVGSSAVEFTYLGETQPKEFLFRLSEVGPGAREQVLRDAYRLTTREAEVLIWIAAGKSNRDIGEILDISARTVNKHLEQIFVKLGVENRASAAAMAVQSLALRG
jgi:DNA-binding response OmpR family regulator/DNA-binding CsgD family transcriptional regulator